MPKLFAARLGLLWQEPLNASVVFPLARNRGLEHIGTRKPDEHERRAMRLIAAKPTGSPSKQASARIIILILVAFLLGVAVSVFWFFRPAISSAGKIGGETNGTPLIALSDGTRTVLKRLDSPVEIRFYSLLDPASVSESEQTFAGRVDQLLSAFQQEAGGKINVMRYNSRPDINAAATAAAADGIPPFNLDKGDACYLGIAVVHNGKKELLPRIFSEWEPALESDLARAIARLIDASPPVKSAAPSIAPVTIEEVKRVIPNLASVSVEEGARILREAALKDFKAAVSEMETQVKEAQQRFSEAQNGGTDADRQAALKHLQQVQADQTEKLQQIAAKSKAQIEALQQLKAAAR
jgi:hypothetical protein